MAIWQFDLYLIPRAAILDRFGEIPARMAPEYLQLEDWWSHVTPPFDVNTRLRDLLPDCCDRSARSRVWGSFEGNRVDVFFQDRANKRPESLFLRIDLRSPWHDFADGLLHLAEDLDCLLVPLESGEILAPCREAVLPAIRKSAAASFLENPRKHLADLHHQADRRRRRGLVDGPECRPAPETIRIKTRDPAGVMEAFLEADPRTRAFLNGLAAEAPLAFWCRNRRLGRLAFVELRQNGRVILEYGNCPRRLAASIEQRPLVERLEREKLLRFSVEHYGVDKPGLWKRLTGPLLAKAAGD